jgi:hypothetical protein
MAVVNLRPIGDITLEHKCSSGSNGYALINEVTCDNDGTYIYQDFTSTSTSTATSSFHLEDSPKNILISNAQICFKRRNTTANSNKVTFSVVLKQRNTTLFSGSFSASSTDDYSQNAPHFEDQLSGITSLSDLSLEITTSSSKSASKNDDFQIRISQVYVHLVYTEASNTYNCAAVAKDNITAATISNTHPIKGDSVVYTATYEKYCPFLGWYSDEACTNLVSTENPFTIVPTSDLTLYAKAGENIGRTITLTMPNTLTFFIGKGVYLGGFKQDLLTEVDYANLKAGKFSSISSEKVWEQNSATGATNKEHKTSVFVPKGCLLAMYADSSASSDQNSELYIYETSGIPLSYIPYYQVVCDDDHNYIVGTEYRCECTANAGDGIKSASVDYPTLIQGEYATFTATVMDGYKWNGWYSDSSRKTLISSNQTYTEQAPYKTSSVAKKTYLSRYAYAEPVDQDYGLYLKQNGSWVTVKQLYVKENGQWVFKLTTNGVFDTNKNYVKGEV